MAARTIHGMPGIYNSTLNTLQSGDGCALAVDSRQRLLVSPDSVPAQASTATLSNVNSSASSVNLLAANTARKGVLVHNDSTAILYIKFGQTASTSSFSVKIASQGSWSMDLPLYTGIIDAIWASADGAARVTELT